jgi:PRC-barrel domain
MQTATATMNEKVTVADQPHRLIASDRVEGTPVRRPDGTKVGTIERVMIDKLTGNVAYAVFGFGGILGMGETFLPIPWGRLTYDRTLGAYQLDLSDEELADATAAVAADETFDWGERGRALAMQDFYKVPPFGGV